MFRGKRVSPQQWLVNREHYDAVQDVENREGRACRGRNLRSDGAHAVVRNRRRMARRSERQHRRRRQLADKIQRHDAAAYFRQHHRKRRVRDERHKHGLRQRLLQHGRLLFPRSAELQTGPGPRCRVVRLADEDRRRLDALRCVPSRLHFRQHGRLHKPRRKGDWRRHAAARLLRQFRERMCPFRRLFLVCGCVSGGVRRGRDGHVHRRWRNGNFQHGQRPFASRETSCLHRQREQLQRMRNRTQRRRDYRQQKLCNLHGRQDGVHDRLQRHAPA